MNTYRNESNNKLMKRAVSRWFFLAEDGKWRDCTTGAALVLKKSEPLPAMFEMKRDGKRALCVTT